MMRRFVSCCAAALVPCAAFCLEASVQEDQVTEQEEVVEQSQEATAASSRDSSPPLSKWNWDPGGDARWFQFQGLEGVPGEEHSERGALRLKLDTSSQSGRFSAEIHGLVEGASPPALSAGFDLSTDGRNDAAAPRSKRYWDLTADLDTTPDRTIVAEMDRLNVRFQNDHVRLTLGRQAVTWGVNYFWPVLDLFTPFSPERIDRDYKPGVDAARFSVAVGQFSEVELIAAVQGPDSNRDRSLGALGRFHLGGVDLGLMLGDFHGDEVLGGFLVGDIAGTGLRLELAQTTTSQEARLEGDPDNFLRATIGVDRLLTPTVSLVFETTYNGYGVEQATQFVDLLARDRVRRGEITSLGELSSGVSLTWQQSPLLSVSTLVLANLHDGSFLLQPSAIRSLTNNSDLLVGIIAGLGDQATSAVLPGSEYGNTPVTIWLAFKTSF